MTATKAQWQLQLEKDGFYVVPNVVSSEDCAEFQEQALQWLERFPHGFKRDDRSTWDEEHLPACFKGGLFNRYSVPHEAFVWKVRTQPKILETFAQIWGTDDLIASFDGVNISLPVNEKTGRTDIDPATPWPHMDTNPRKYHDFGLYQGIANLAPNGPQDGGLCVLKGSHLLHAEHFANIGGFRPEKDSGEDQNGYGFLAEDAEWYKEQGCEEVKICAGEGDLILWDSRLIHWNSSPVGERIRFVSYVCYCPRSLMSDEDLSCKLEIFKARKGTTHWPQLNVVPTDRKGYAGALPRRPDGTLDPANRTRPFTEPEETEVVWRLVGLRA